MTISTSADMRGTAERRTRRYGRLLTGGLGLLAALLWILTGVVCMAAALLRLAALLVGKLADLADQADAATARHFGTTPQAGLLLGMRARIGGAV